MILVTRLRYVLPISRKHCIAWKFTFSWILSHTFKRQRIPNFSPTDRSKVSKFADKSRRMTSVTCNAFIIEKVQKCCTVKYIWLSFSPITHWKQMLQYSQTWANDHLHNGQYFEVPFLIFITLRTSEQRPPVNNGHYFWVPRAVVIQRVDCMHK